MTYIDVRMPKDNLFFDLMLPPSFNSHSPSYRLRVIFPEHTTPAALFSFANRRVLERPEIIEKTCQRAKKTQIHISYLYY
jgi:hypothetical protein